MKRSNGGKRVRIVSFALMLFVLCGGATRFGPAVMAQVDNGSDFLEELKLFGKALGAISYAYVEEINLRQLLYQAVRGMLTSLNDRYSEFIEPERYEKLKTMMKGEYAGIGIVLELKDNFPVIGKVLEGGPAEKAGLQVLDRITGVDGVATEGKGLPDVSAMIKGEIGTQVVLSIYRVAARQALDVTLTRDKILIEAVKDVRIVGRAVGYMKIEDFQEHTVEQVDKALADLKGKGMEALIIDLRNNDGGLLPKAVDLAERFLGKDQKIVSVTSKVPEQKKEYVSSGKFTQPDYPVVILVNQFSASASEIFSAAMQDHKRAKIVGVKTYGKASVQSVIPLDEASAMKLTTARYISPSGRVIDKVGIVPDVEVHNGTPGQPNADHQTVKALEILKKYF